MRKIAFTGHRLDKLPYKNESDPNCATLKRKLFCEAQKHLLPDQTIYLSGMANGVDLWAAEQVILLKNAFLQLYFKNRRNSRTKQQEGESIKFSNFYDLQECLVLSQKYIDN